MVFLEILSSPLKLRLQNSLSKRKYISLSLAKQSRVSARFYSLHETDELALRCPIWEKRGSKKQSKHGFPFSKPFCQKWLSACWIKTSTSVSVPSVKIFVQKFFVFFQLFWHTFCAKSSYYGTTELSKCKCDNLVTNWDCKIHYQKENKPLIVTWERQSVSPFLQFGKRGVVKSNQSMDSHFQNHFVKMIFSVLNQD